MLRQITAIRFTDDGKAEALQHIGAAFKAISALVPGIRRFDYGPDLVLLEGAYDYALVIDFDDAESWRSYRDHPEHLAFAAKFAAYADAAVRVQYEVS